MAPQQWEVVGGKASGGILVRSGKDTKSAEVPQRLATGSVIEELELVGERMKFKLLEGSGPSEGWISLKLKDKPLVVEREVVSGPQPPKMEPPNLDVGAVVPPADRLFDIIIHGATGFTGMLAVQHMDALMQQAGREEMRWAIAGRSRAKLEQVKALCKTSVGIIETKTDDEVVDMIGQTRVLLAGAGPYALCGENVIRGCVAHGTHYVDFTGETWWLKHMIAKYDAEARKRGVILVSMCGMMSTATDVSTRLLVEKLGPLKQVHAYIIQFAFSTGGTDFSGRTTMEMILKHPEFYKDAVDAYSLGGLRACGLRDIDEDVSAPSQDPNFPKVWGGAVSCATVDSRCVRRSCMLFEESRGGKALQYGKEMNIKVREPFPAKGGAQNSITMFGRLPSADTAKLALEGMNKGLAEGQSAKVGLGPSPETREKCYVKYFVVAEAEDGKYATCKYDGGEPYEVTAMSSATACLVLAESLGAANPKECGGFCTPAYAFAATNFVDLLRTNRWAGLEKHAKMSWEIVEGKPDEAEMLKLVTDRTKTFMIEMSEGKLKTQALPDYKK